MQVRAYSTKKNIILTPFLLFLYLALFLSTYLTDRPPSVPDTLEGLDVEQAWADLHKITSHPHSYNSHESDAVRTFILSRLSDLGDLSYVHIVDDLQTNVSYVDNGAATYFEGKNILVKIDGSDPDFVDKGGVLFSAHLDSVSTSVGATDDGMAVVTLVQLVTYFSINRPRRTAVFNINDGEEDGLNGAHTFLNHPWSAIPDTFINFEGGGAGGRPVFFRTTSLAPTLAALRQFVPHPHANVLSRDAFDLRLIRSGTDFSVYADGGGYSGADLSFYKHRCYYHTKYDSIPFIDGQKKSLWSMMETAIGASRALLNVDWLHDKSLDVPAVFFDLFSAVLIAFSKDTLLILDIIVLVLCPSVLVILFVYNLVPTLRLDISSVEGMWFSVVSNAIWPAFWIGLASTVILESLLVYAYLKWNPFAIYSLQNLVFFTMMSLALLSLQFSIRLYLWYTRPKNPQSKAPTSSSRQEEMDPTSSILTQLYIFTWFLTVIGAALLAHLGIGGTYILTAWNVSIFVSVILDGGYLRVSRKQKILNVGGQDNRSQKNGDEKDETHRPVVNSERVSLRIKAIPLRYLIPSKEGSEIYRWLATILVSVATPVVLAQHLVTLLLAGMAHTLPDGSDPLYVYVGITFFAVISVLPMSPWSPRVHPAATLTALLFFVASMVYSLSAFPFSQDAPLKVFFQQTITFDAQEGWQVPSSALSSATPAIDFQHEQFGFHQMHLSSRETVNGSWPSLPSVRTVLVGVPRYLPDVVPAFPSTFENPVECAHNHGRSGTIRCSWNTSGLIPAADGTSTSNSTNLANKRMHWIQANITRTGTTSARFSIRPTNSRYCRIWFDSRKLAKFTVLDSGRVGAEPRPPYLMPEEGVKELRLFARDWNRVFVVDVEWKGDDHYFAGEPDSLQGWIACEWNEYASGRVGSQGEHLPGSIIPAFEEILSYAPKWVAVSKMHHGLLEVAAPFVIEK